MRGTSNRLKKPLKKRLAIRLANSFIQRFRSRPTRGFTLIEVLVAISIMAVMAVLSWRGLDAMTQTQNRLQQRADEVLTLQAGLAQWGTDLDMLIQLPQTQALDWDGRALRITRRSAAQVPLHITANNPGEEAVQVVAWSRRSGDSADSLAQWLRWQSPPLRTRGEVALAWAAAAQWAQNPGDDLKKREVRLGPLSQWQVFFYRNDAWTNPLSSAGQQAAAAPVGTALPEGVRLVLTLPPGQAISGVLTRDWIRPTIGGNKT
jgi:general secretion pathway protein J